MRSFTSDRLKPHNRDDEPLSVVGLLVRVGLFIVTGFPITAQKVSGARH
jgi:hypothetical protein